MKLKDRLQELGLEGESSIMKTYGNKVFTVSEEQLLPKVLEWEIQIRTEERELAVLVAKAEKLKEEKEKKEMLSIRLSQEVAKYFPEDKMKDEAYKTLYPGFMARTVAEVIKTGSVSLDDKYELILGEIPEKHPENMSALDRLLHDAHVSRYSNKENSLERLITDTVKQGGGHNFFKR